MGLVGTKSASGFRPLRDELDPEWPSHLRDKPEGVANAVISEVPFDCCGTIGEGEDCRKFDKLELVQGVTVWWEKGVKLGVVGFGEVRSLGKGPHWQVCWDHGKLFSNSGGVDMIEF